MSICSSVKNPIVHYPHHHHLHTTNHHHHVASSEDEKAYKAGRFERWDGRSPSSPNHSSHNTLNNLKSNKMFIAHYPTPSQNRVSEPMVHLARTIIDSTPKHSRNHSTTASSFSIESEKTPLISTALKSTASKVRSYGAIVQRKQEQKKEELKRLISRPISHESSHFDDQYCNAVQGKVEKEKLGEGEGEKSIGSVYSTRTWANETEDELERIGGAFEFDMYCRGEVKEGVERSSIQTFASSERSYTFF